MNSLSLRRMKSSDTDSATRPIWGNCPGKLILRLRIAVDGVDSPLFMVIESLKSRGLDEMISLSSLVISSDHFTY
jgi:hypothetical protein